MQKFMNQFKLDGCTELLEYDIHQLIDKEKYQKEQILEKYRRKINDQRKDLEKIIYERKPA